MPPPTVKDLDYTTVYGQALILDPSGALTPVYPGSITFTPSTVLRDLAGNAFFFPSRTFTANTDVNGNWTINLPASDDPDITPTGWTYLVAETWPGGRSYSIGVPYNPPSGDRTVAFASIAPAPASSGVALFGYLGPQGAQGSQGVAGAQGPTGSQGPAGAQGAQGAQGAVGAQGTTGSQGPQGTQGLQGATGSQGTAGAQGSQGTQGAAGTQGAQGSQGSQGSAGSDTWPKLMPTNVIAESAWRGMCTNTNGALTSGTLKMTAVWLPAGKVIGHLGAFTANTATSSPTHSWAALFDSSRVMLAASADAGSAAIGVTALLSYAIATTAGGAATTFTTTYEGLYYVGWLVVAATVPNCYGPPTQSFSGGPLTTTPALNGSSNSGLTTVPAFPFTTNALAADTVGMYANVGS